MVELIEAVIGVALTGEYSAASNIDALCLSSGVGDGGDGGNESSSVNYKSINFVTHDQDMIAAARSVYLFKF